MENCIFCKIVSGEIPAEKAYEDDKLVAFLDYHPARPGHVLVGTAKHYHWFGTLPDDVARIETASKVAQAARGRTL